MYVGSFTEYVPTKLAIRLGDPPASVSPNPGYIIQKYNMKDEGTHCEVAQLQGVPQNRTFLDGNCPMGHRNDDKFYAYEQYNHGNDKPTADTENLSTSLSHN